MKFHELAVERFGVELWVHREGDDLYEPPLGVGSWPVMLSATIKIDDDFVEEIGRQSYFKDTPTDLDKDTIVLNLLGDFAAELRKLG